MDIWIKFIGNDALVRSSIEMQCHKRREPESFVGMIAI